MDKYAAFYSKGNGQCLKEKSMLDTRSIPSASNLLQEDACSWNISLFDQSGLFRKICATGPVAHVTSNLLLVRGTKG